MSSATSCRTSGNGRCCRVFHDDAHRLSGQLGRVDGLLRQLGDRLSEPPGDWSPAERVERHRFYAAAAAVVVRWLDHEVILLRQAIHDLEATLVNAIASAATANAAHSATVRAAQAVVDDAAGTTASADEVAALIAARAPESGEWTAVRSALTDADGDRH
jgi:hypothetical protein